MNARLVIPTIHECSVSRCMKLLRPKHVHVPVELGMLEQHEVLRMPELCSQICSSAHPMRFDPTPPVETRRPSLSRPESLQSTDMASHPKPGRFDEWLRIPSPRLKPIPSDALTLQQVVNESTSTTCTPVLSARGDESRPSTEASPIGATAHM